MIRFNRECGWAWSEWEDSMVLVVLEHADINTEDIYVESMDNEEITLFVKERILDGCESTTSKYIIRYFEDTAICECLMFAYFFYSVEGSDMTLLDNGAYQIRKINGIFKHLRLDD